MFLEDAQELRLQFQWNITHLVEEKRAFVRQLEAANLARGGAGESTPLVPEQIAFEQPGWDGRATDPDQRPVPPWARAMHGARDELLARAGFPLEQDGGIRG